MTDFETLYQTNPDPWAVATSWYERRKHSVLMSALPRERYRHGLELGCGTGVTTRSLAARCDTLHAVDAAPTALALCERTLADDGLENVRLGLFHLPEDWPLGDRDTADLIVVSELAYYLDGPSSEHFVIRCAESLAASGDWLMCHYIHPFHDRCQNTDAIHDTVDRLPGFDRIVAHRDEDFRLDIWRKQ